MRFLFLLLLSTSSLLAQVSELESEVRRFVDVYNLLENRLAEPFDAETAFYQGAIPAMVQTLDPHSAFLGREQYESLQQMQSSTEKGFGSVVSLLPGRVIVLQTLDGSPSAQAGLTPGDEIVAVNGYPLSELSTEQLSMVLGQSRRQKAELLVRKPGFTRLVPVTLVPAELADPSVRRHFLLRPGVGYVKVATFEIDTPYELQQAIDEMGSRDLDGLVLDLRDNPGGVVEAAVQIASFFLEPEQRILWIEGRDGPQEDVRVPEGHQPYSFPVSVLVNSHTASAAELVTGALQDHGRAVVIGEPSFGKGLVQSVFELSEGTALALTTARYLTPSRRSIQRNLGDCRVYQLVHCEVPGDPRSESSSVFGEPVAGPGGINPDQIVYPHAYTDLEVAIEASNSFFDFAQKYVRDHPNIGRDWQVSPKVLDDFQLFLSERRIRPSLPEWTAAISFSRNRLKQEIFNLAFGVDKGDEVEADRDPLVRAAVASLETQLKKRGG